VACIKVITQTETLKTKIYIGTINVVNFTLLSKKNMCVKTKTICITLSKELTITVYNLTVYCLIVSTLLNNYSYSFWKHWIMKSMMFEPILHLNPILGTSCTLVPLYQSLYMHVSKILVRCIRVPKLFIISTCYCRY